MSILYTIRPYIALWGMYMTAFWFAMLVLAIFAMVAGTSGGFDYIFSPAVAGELQVEPKGASGILELWLHEVIRAIPMLIPGAGAVWGFIVAFTAYPLFSAIMTPEYLAFSGTGALLFFVLQPFLAANALAHVILIKHSITWAKTLWSLRDMEDGRIDALRDLVKPTSIAVGVAIACLFVSATIVYVSTIDAYSPAAMHLDMIGDGAIEKMAGLVYRTVSLFWVEPDWDNVQEALL